MFDESNPGIFRDILERLLTGIYVVDRSRKIVLWNDGAEKITGYLRQEVLGRFCRDNLLEHCDGASQTLCHRDCPLTKVMQEGQPRESHMYLRHRDGRRFPVLVRAVAIRDNKGEIVAAAESFEVQLPAPTVGNLPRLIPEHLDELTGLPNSGFVLHHLQQRTEPGAKIFRPFTLLRIAVSHYQELRRRYGATACAGLLRNAAQSMRQLLKPADILARWGESRFVAVLEIHDKRAVQKVRERLQSAVDGTSLDWWGDSIALQVVIEERTVERREDRQSVLSWLGPTPADESTLPHPAVHIFHCGSGAEE
jgi:PAS domain S-box-containing protein/diguanylate cyclase (GGDEF)-like protein